MDEPSKTLAPSLLPSAPITPRSSPSPPSNETRSCPVPSSGPCATEFTTPSSPEPANDLITPPATPPKNKKAMNSKASSQSTPNSVGKILRNFSDKATASPKTPNRKMLSAVFEEEADVGGKLVDVFVKKYVEFVSQHPEIKMVGAKTAGQNMGRCIHVASYIPLSPPLTAPIDNKEMMALLFARDLKYTFSYIHCLTVGILKGLLPQLVKH